MEDKKELFDWFWQQTFTADQIKELLDKIRVFNCGAIDSYLDNHIDKVFAEWLKEQK